MREIGHLLRLEVELEFLHRALAQQAVAAILETDDRCLVIRAELLGVLFHLLDELLDIRRHDNVPQDIAVFIEDTCAKHAS